MKKTIFRVHHAYHIDRNYFVLPLLSKRVLIKKDHDANIFFVRCLGCRVWYFYSDKRLTLKGDQKAPVQRKFLDRKYIVHVSVVQISRSNADTRMNILLMYFKIIQ